MIGKMQNSFFSLFISVCLSILLFCTPLVAQAQEIFEEAKQVSEGDPCATAYRDAETNINKTMWFVIGCLAGLVGWIIAYAIEPNPPAASLVGKSPQYVATYSDCYKRKGKSSQTNAALVGCLIGTAASVLLWVAVFATAEESNTGY